jgi:hypothetical protein
VYVNERRATKEFENKKMVKEIRIIKKGDAQKFEDYTFIDNSIELRKIDNEKNDGTSSKEKKYKEYEFKLRNNPKNDLRSRNKSRLVGGHGAQSHSPVYE